MNAHTPPAPASVPPKTPLHTLIRVRNNQRRHRQRRQEYIRSLEQRLAAAEERASQLQIENDALRRDLSSSKEDVLGQTTDTLPSSASPLTMDLHPSSIESLADDAISFHRLVPGSNPTTLSAPIYQPDPTLQQFPTQWDAASPVTGLSLASLPYPPGSAKPAAEAACLSASPSCCSHLASSPMYSGPAEPPFYSVAAAFVTASTTTTLCSQAYILIQQCNRRGLSMALVQSWLWPGFSHGEDALVNGCRVDSGLLQGLLEYISGGGGVEVV